MGIVRYHTLRILILLNILINTDCLNILYIINKDFLERANEIFNPRNAMCISRNDGTFDNSINHQRDLIININTFTRLGRKYHTEEELNTLRTIMYNNRVKRKMRVS